MDKIAREMAAAALDLAVAIAVEEADRVRRDILGIESNEYIEGRIAGSMLVVGALRRKVRELRNGAATK